MKDIVHGKNDIHSSSPVFRKYLVIKLLVPQIHKDSITILKIFIRISLFVWEIKFGKLLRVTCCLVFGNFTVTIRFLNS